MRNQEIQFCSLPTSKGSLILSYRIERSDRLRRMQLQISSSEMVTLRIPRRYSEKQALAFLYQNADWVETMLAKQPAIPKLRVFLARHGRLSLEGVYWRLLIRAGTGRMSYEFNPDLRQVTLTFDPTQDDERQLFTLLKETARCFLPQRLEYFSKKHRLKYHGVTIRDQRGRWGSCSETGGISLNWRLILVPPHLQDHILLHELAHLKHFDHSVNFYNFLTKLEFNAVEHARELDALTPSIIALGRFNT